jgi:glycosyltransferase involved in cell wall biosynthesis
LQAEELTRRGHQVTVVCPNFAGRPREKVDLVEVVRVWRGPDRIQRYLYGPLFFFRLLRDAASYDIVHVHYPGIIGKTAVLAGWLRRRKVYFKVTTAPDLGTPPVLERWLRFPTREYLGLRLAARVQALTVQIREQLQAAGVAPDAIRLIPNGVDLHVFGPVQDEQQKLRLRRELDLPSGKAVILYAGRIERSKGVDVLLSAWRSLRREVEVELVLVGKRSAGPASERIRAESGLKVREWTDAIRDYYQAADIFVLPSFREGMSNAVLEAMACGLPAIVTPAGAAVDVVRNGENGLVVPVGDARALQCAMLSLVEDPALRLKLGTAAAESSKAYSVRSVVDQIEAVYAEMMPRQRMSK